MQYRERFKELLVNPTPEESEKREPLLKFSWFLSDRVHILMGFADEIVNNLDRMGPGQISFNGQIVDNGIDGSKIGRAESLTWLWILGAYEVVRTMCQAKDCFSERLLKEIQPLKKSLAEIRMPAAKMEKTHNRGYVPSTRSFASGMDYDNKDLFINAPEEPIMSVRKIICEFDRIFCSMMPEDVLKRHGSV